MSRHLLALPLLLLVACAPSGDPADERFASELGVDLSTMEKRESGLYVEDLVEGTGPEAGDETHVIVAYTGWLTDGTKFASTRDEGREPIQFVLGAHQVLPGLEEG
ncbi:MAG: FKBP-type peptidyl-prolyl cis-trans isomerase, partial [Myxococcaceae bacterium]|nr:FKBP-type peptidyl-prolyl cis-trans isomerase [Myxococcaceae bacterium]